ncbi:MAG: hypothetical protein L3J07_00205 [Candidatus Magasanikbacteria bacterium]|nr:hypothetical protein [Candidatus Magasanikbacteria bacterium]
MTAKLAQLTVDQVVEKEKEFQLMIADPKKAEETWKELHEFFKNATFSDVQKHWETYWRWYTELTWKRLNALPEDAVVNVAVALQIPMALMLNYDVWERLMWYLGLRTYEEKELASLYVKIRDAFMNSRAFLGKSNGKDYVVRDFVEKVKILERKDEDSIETAEFYDKIRTIIKEQSCIVNKYIEVDINDFIKSLRSLVAFFLGVKPENAPSVVEIFMYPELIEAAEKTEEYLKNLEEEKEEVLEPKKEEVVETPFVEEKPAEIIEELKEELAVEEKVELEKIEEVPVEKTVVEEALVAPAEEKVIPTKITKPILEEKPEESKMSLEDIKKMIESRFADKEGKIENIESVFTLLNSIADDQKDESLRELYYFDEEKGDFTWNI